MNIRHLCFSLCASGVVLALFAVQAQAQTTTVVNDSWADGGRTNGADALDTDWWTTSSSSAIEVAVGELGLVTGSSGRGIRASFAAQTLGIGDNVTATYTFTTPATVGTNRGNAFRVGMYDRQGNAGFEADLSASSGTPNAIYDGVPGYMADYDVNLTVPADSNVNIREHNLASTVGRLLGTTSGYDRLGGSSGAAYAFLASTEYVGMFSVTRTGADTADIFTSLSQGGGLLHSHMETDSSGIANNFGMLAFHSNSATFGSSNSAGVADNGINFSNVTVATTAVPEPGTTAFLLGGGLLLGMVRRRK